MLFLTYWFVIYTAILYPLYWFVAWPRLRLWILLIGCSAFHTHFAGPAGVVPIIILSALTFGIGLTRRPVLCYVGIAINVAALVYYKYTTFIINDILRAAFPGSNSLCDPPSAFSSIIPPLAISFFVFEFVHYLTDVSRGEKPIRSTPKFTLFTIFWPSIAAGPVKRYQEFLPSVSNALSGVSEHDVAAGMIRTGVGFFKKCIADNLTLFLTVYGKQFESIDITWRWVFVAFLALRILLDFSGYSDIAIGFARMHGIALPENFNWPYLATDLSDFWRRWHISLSTWIRDYIYIALGGNRCGLIRKVFNGLFAFALCGLWHGAGWNFLFWGVYHGAGLAVCTTYRAWLPGGKLAGDAMERYPQVGWILTLLFVGIGWLFFFYPLPRAFEMIQLLCRGH